MRRLLSWSQLYKPLILCVDNDLAMLDLIRAALESKGYRVLTASDGDYALGAFTACPIDAVVLGDNMAAMKEGEVAREMARIKPNIPKLLFSAAAPGSGANLAAFQGYCSKAEGLFSLPVQLGALTPLAQTA